MLPLDGDGFPPLHFSVLSEALGTFQPFSRTTFRWKKKRVFFAPKVNLTLSFC